MKKQIFLLYSCDIWKSTDSMHLLFVGTSQQKLVKKITKEIETGNMEYKNVTCEMDFDGEKIIRKDKINSPKEQADLFMKDIKKLDLREIGASLNYGYIEYP